MNASPTLLAATALFCFASGAAPDGDAPPAEGEASRAPAGSTSTAPPTGGTDSRALGPNEIPAAALSYTMRASLSPKTRKVIGRAVIKWTVPGNSEVTAVPMHLYLNAFANEASTWISGAALRRDFDIDDQLKHFDDPWGYIVMNKIEQMVTETAAAGEPGSPANPDAPAGAGATGLAAAGKAAAPPPSKASDAQRVALDYAYIQPDDHNEADRTLALVNLAQPVAPGETLELHIKFTSRLPVPIARTGGHSGYFHVAQWFPKLGMYEVEGQGGAAQDGFDARQFHGPTEFYAEFADYDVTLNVPVGYRVVATGARPDDPNYIDDDPATLQKRNAEVAEVRYTQRGVHDFAWLASNRIVVERETYDPAGPGGPLTLSYVVPTDGTMWIERMRRATRATFDTLGARVGPYPYSTMKVIFPAQSALETSGMEYPTLVTGLPGDALFSGWPLGELELAEGVIAHEVTHNYFYGLVASNEQENAFLDEGFTQFWEYEIMEEMTAPGGPAGTLLGFPMDRVESGRRGYIGARDKIREPVTQVPAAIFYPGAHGTQIYMRSWGILRTMKAHFGQAVIDEIFSTYFARFRFQHPIAEDFFSVVDEIAPPKAAAMLREQYALARLPDFAIDGAESEPVDGAMGIHIARGSEAQALEVYDEVPAEGRAGAFRLTREGAERGDGRAMGWPALAEPGAITAFRTDPADLMGPRRSGEVTRVALEASEGPEWGEHDGDEEPGTMYRTVVRVTGPGLAHLSTEIEFVFNDGRTARDVWAAKNAWRSYEIFHSSRLHSVRIDPDDKIVVDADPSNNGVRLETEHEGAPVAAGLLSSLVQWLAMGVTWWL